MDLTREQFEEMVDMKPGDIFTYRQGSMLKKAEFISFKKVNILAKVGEGLYNIRKTNFVHIVGHAEQKEQPRMNMKPGELFYIKQGNNAILFEFVRYNAATIIGKDVLTGGNVRIAKSLFAGTVKQYLKEQKKMAKAE